MHTFGKIVILEVIKEEHLFYSKPGSFIIFIFIIIIQTHVGRPIYYYNNTTKEEVAVTQNHILLQDLSGNYEREQWIVIWISTWCGCARLHWITSRRMGIRKGEDIMSVTCGGRRTHVFTQGFNAANLQGFKAVNFQHPN